MVDDGLVTERPLVSIGVPTCDRDSFLERALESLTGQDYPNLEIIISDNASTDQTPAVCARFQERHPFVRYDRSRARIGAFENFRRVLMLARGRYFMWASDDDLWAATFVSTLVNRLEADPALALAAAEAQYMLIDGTRLPVFPEGQAFYRSQRSRWGRLLTVVWHNYGNLFYGLYRRQTLLTANGGTVLDGIRSLNEIPVFVQVAWRGAIAVCREVLFFKTARVATYLQAAREYGITPKFHGATLPPGRPSGTGPEGREFVPTPTRAWTSIARVVAYHVLALGDIRRALWRLDAGWVARVTLWVIFAFWLAVHLVKVAAFWPAQDAVRRAVHVVMRRPRPGSIRGSD